MKARDVDGAREAFSESERRGFVAQVEAAFEKRVRKVLRRSCGAFGHCS
jgi:hypothetical protein